MPSATMPTTVETGIRRPRMHGTPSIWSARTVILTKVIDASLPRRMTPGRHLRTPWDFSRSTPPQAVPGFVVVQYVSEAVLDDDEDPGSAQGGSDPVDRGTS